MFKLERIRNLIPLLCIDTNQSGTQKMKMSVDRSRATWTTRHYDKKYYRLEYPRQDVRRKVRKAIETGFQLSQHILE